jgi:enamine deaminase RidA (YjgF/YER057c/UK114 family)
VKQTIAAPGFAHYPDDWHFSPVLISGDFAFFSGQTGTHADGTFSPNPEQQFRDAFSFLAANLAAAELGFHDIIEMTTYHVDLRRHLASFIKVKDEHIRPPYPAWTAIGISELITPGALVEIRVIARQGS